MPLLKNENRLRAVSAASVVGASDEHVAALVRSLDNSNHATWVDFENDSGLSDSLQRLRFTLKEQDLERNPQDSFRRARGFQAVLSILQALASVWHEAVSTEKIKSATQILSLLLSVLEAAFELHPGNNKYFRVRIQHNGWTLLTEILGRIIDSMTKQPIARTYILQLYGTIFASTVGNDALTDIYLQSGQQEIFTKSIIQAKIEEAVKDVHHVVVPDMLGIFLNSWSRYRTKQSQSSSFDLALVLSVQAVLNKSRQNLVEANSAGIFSVLRPLLFDSVYSDEEREVLRDIALSLCFEGVTQLEDAHKLVTSSVNNITAAKFLLDVVRTSRRPPSIQFDLSKNGSSSAELANLRKPFPCPDSSSAGYSLALWARFDYFDENAHTTLFGAFDKTHTCFILAYLEKDTKHLILQSAIRGSKPSVRFKSVKFEPDRWYHICITHRKPKVATSSKASLFVDGEFMEQIKATFPSTAPVDRASSTIKVQAFFGTPQDLSPDTGHRACLSQWHLSSAILYEDVLSDDLVAVMFHLGPRYYGNLQDCLGSFQTYRASAELNLRNESLNPGKEEASDLMVAIRHKASNIVQEHKILLNISPAAVLDDDDRTGIDESQLIKSLSKLAAKNLLAYTRSGANAVAANGAVPAINDAMVQTNGVLVLMGDPTVIVPQSFDDVSFRLGGCSPVGLSLVQQARTTEEVAIAVETLFEMIRENWRNSEIMERDNGYGILCNLIHEKIQPQHDPNRGSAAIPTPSFDRNDLAVKLLNLILSFVGYNHDDEGQSLIINALAYRILLVDTSLWRTFSYDTQELFFKQLTVFAAGSLHSRYNVKRLNRMRALRRLIEALKGEPVPRQIVPFYSAALKALLPHALTTEMLRSVALFINFSIHKQDVSRPRKTLHSEARSRASSSSSIHGTLSATPENANLTPFEVGLEVLRVYSDILCARGDTSIIRKFAKTVTNKWLLYLLSESSPEVIVLSVRIIARLLVVHGDSYVRKFKDRSGGFTLMCHRLKRWWHLPALWPVCFSVLFGFDVADLDLDRSFDLFSFVDLFNSRDQYRIAYPEMFPVIMTMLQSGLRSIASSKPSSGTNGLNHKPEPRLQQTPQRLSMSTMAPPNPELTIVSPQHIDTFNTVVRFLADIQTRSQRFRDFTTTSSYIQDLLYALYPVVVGSDIVDASVELSARDSVLSFEGTDLVVHPLTKSTTLVHDTNAKSSAPTRRKGLRRGSSFVVIPNDVQQQISPLTAGPSPQRTADSRTPSLQNEHNAIVQTVLELVVTNFIEQIIAKKEFPGLGLFLRTPPGFVEHQHFFESWILRNTVSQLSSVLALDQSVMCEPRVLTNLSRFFSHLGESVFEGWCVDGAEPVLDLAGSVLEYLQRPDISQLKGVRLCAQPTSVIRSVVFKTIILSLSQSTESNLIGFLTKLTYWQNVLLSTDDPQSGYLQHICYLLYGSLTSSANNVRQIAANLWRIILVQKPEQAAALFNQADVNDQKQLITEFGRLIEQDNDAFLTWVDDHRKDLDTLFSDILSRQWDNFVAEENAKTEDAARSRISRRREKLKSLTRDEVEREELIRRHEVTFDHWTANIYSSENLKYQRLMQDQQDDRAFVQTAFRRMQRELSRSTGLFAEDKSLTWKLDQTEGRNRMRMRLVENFEKEQSSTQPKRKGTETPALRLDIKVVKPGTSEETSALSAAENISVTTPRAADHSTEPFPEIRDDLNPEDAAEIEESFEIVDDPNLDEDGFEDKNRKVMRSLHRGDQVKHVANISRIIGLEAVEGLLILGKDYIYLIDNFFQRKDGEIVNVWQAPPKERDPYVKVISGRDVVIKRPQTRADEHEARSWKWSEILSVSKRRFLFRDVSIEIFFTDGRSYLLTMVSSSLRNDVFSRISSKAPQYGNADAQQSEFTWRYETLRSPEEEPQTFSARFTNVFAQSPVLTATRKWQKGEMSNFHYLMLINTMAGRTYNDLTQYPVFPWVIADYRSEELDLTNPRSFRDLSKPMGCQTPEREMVFRDRYKSFAEMGDHNAPPFHYGTHYSSAMIVSSYLIRLEPFVKSYLLLQGGTFDHPDRMFFSIEQAWRSASAVNMTDVRELTPEFFYLPEFLSNLNGYDFGTRQNSEQSIGTVELPPWAKGDPRIFIAKNREALESPYVSTNLHKWIDLVFGCKQKGEAAVEAVNVFHHLSYQGAKDLDAITDSVERLATIGIIHNFGQTPYQVFPKPHPPRENTQHKYKRLDTAAESLTRLPSTILESEEKVASLTYAPKTDRLLCSGAFRLNIPPTYDKYMEWGFFDGSIRFYSAETRKQIGLFEHLHIGQLSCAVFADSRTLITSGIDCTVGVWNVVYNAKSIDLQPRATLFGHHQPVNVLALSQSFSVLLSASSDGELMLWDLNRCEFVRRIKTVNTIQVECSIINDVNGNIILCHDSRISIYSINGDLLLMQDTSDREATDEQIISVSCYEGAGNEWLERDVLFTGHKKGVVKVWNKIINRSAGMEGELPFELELIRQLNHVDPSRDDGGNVSAGISCMLTMPQVVYTGDEEGRVYEWNCVQRH